MGSMFWAEVLCWDDSFSAGCLCVFQGWHLDLQTHGRLIENGLQAGLLIHVACNLPMFFSDQMASGLSHWHLCADYTLTAIGSMQVAPWHAAPGFHCLVQPKSLLHSVAKGRVFFWLLQSLWGAERFSAPYQNVSNARVVWVGGSLMVVFRKVHPNDSTHSVPESIPSLFKSSPNKLSLWAAQGSELKLLPRASSSPTFTNLGLDCWYRRSALL